MSRGNRQSARQCTSSSSYITFANFSDLAFVLDCTGSMQRYINATRDHVIGICDMIRGEQGLNGPDDLRVAVCQLELFRARS